MLTGGIIIGSLIAALISGNFDVHWPRQKSAYIRVMIGGLLMGYGAGLASGCTIGGVFSAIPSLGLNGLVFGASIFTGALAGLRLIKKLA